MQRTVHQLIRPRNIWFSFRHCEAAKRPKQSVFEIASSPSAPRNDSILFISRTTRGGFTLLEILLTLVLLAVGVVAIAGFFSYALESSLDAEYTEIATMLAQARMEEIRNIAYDSVVDEARASIAGFPLFQRQVEIDKDVFPIADLKQVTVMVYWQFKGKEASEQLVTYVSKN